MRMKSMLGLLLLTAALGWVRTVSAGLGQWTEISMESAAIVDVKEYGPDHEWMVVTADKSIYYVSTDEGVTWEDWNYGAEAGKVVFSPWGTAESWSIDNERLMYSEDGRYPWRVRSPGVVISDLALDPNIEGHLLAFSYDSTYESYDGGRTYVPRDIPSNLKFVPNVPGALYRYSSGLNKLLISFDSGVTWIERYPPEEYITHCLIQPDHSIYVTTHEQIWNLKPQSLEWVKTAELPGDINAICQPECDDPSILVTCASLGVFRSTDGGFSWNLQQSCHPSSLYANRSKVLVAASDGIWMSTDYGVTFRSIRSGLHTNRVQNIIFDRADPTRWWSIQPGLFTTTDSGRHWIPWKWVPTDGIQALTQDLADTDTWYGTGYLIAYISRDGMRSWQTFNECLSESDRGRPFVTMLGDSGEESLVMIRSGNSMSLSGDSSWVQAMIRDFEEECWEIGNWSAGHLQDSCGLGTAEVPFVYQTYDLYLSRDLGESWERPDLTCSSYEINCFDSVPAFPDRLFIGLDEGIRIIDLGTQETILRETGMFHDILPMDSENYLLAGRGVTRSTASHGTPVFVGYPNWRPQRFIPNPLDPNQLIVLGLSGAKEFTFDPLMPLPEPPTAIHSSAIDDSNVMIGWSLSADAAGCRLYFGKTLNDLELIDAIPDYRLTHVLNTDKWDSESNDAWLACTSYNRNGQEGAMSEPIRVPIGAQRPLIRMFGARQWQSNSNERYLVVSALISDPQGNTTIGTVELLVFDQETSIFLHDDGIAPDSAAGDGLFSVRIDLPADTVSTNVGMGVRVTDDDGHIVSTNGSLQASTGGQP